MSDYFKPLARQGFAIESVPIVTYDVETTAIPKIEDAISSELIGVEPRFLTAFGKRICLGLRVESFDELATAIDADLWPLLDTGTMVTGWFANRFDLRLILEALLRRAKGYKLQPFLTSRAQLRGAIIRKGKKKALFCDGAAMLGLTCSLKDFLTAFAPAYPKLDVPMDKGFDATNPIHIAYAMRDSEGLWHGMMQARKTIKKVVGLDLQMTIAQLAIKSFVRRMPPAAKVYSLPRFHFEAIRQMAFRGGLVLARHHRGPVWAYDQNAAYAAAMRDCWLPAGPWAVVKGGLYDRHRPGIYYGVLSRSSPAAIPYLVRDDRFLSVQTIGDPIATWLCSNEIDTLLRHGWSFDLVEGVVWYERFRMRWFVRRLEKFRIEHPAESPESIIAKSIGNAAFGKMISVPLNGNYVLAIDRPKGGVPVCDDHGVDLDDIWFVANHADGRRFFSRPQLASFITAHVRCKVYDAIMLAPDHFVLSDTDCVVFDQPVDLPIDPRLTGYWKCLSEGTEQITIGKKLYYRNGKAVAAGLKTKNLTYDLFRQWFSDESAAPVQLQMHLANVKRSLEPKWFIAKRRR